MLKYLASAILLLILAACQPDPAPADPPKIDLSELTIAKIHAAYRAEEYTAADLVEAYLARIDTFDGYTNAITITNGMAQERARALDNELQETGQLRPLHGIPVIVKDNINTRFMPTTAGALALRNFIPEEDAPIIEKLEAAGAIILAKSNMAEWAFSPKHTESSTAGTTRNPYDLDHVPAGSSGGTAAAIAANFATVGLGTDTGNSIRGPSSHCALVGFRSTIGLVSIEGIVPLYARNDVVGPMCRTVEDAARLLEVLTGKPTGEYQKALVDDGLQGARIGVLRALSESDADPEIRALFGRAIADLRELGATVVDPVTVPRFAELRRDQWCETFRDDLESFLATYVKIDTVATLEDIARIGTKSDYARENIEFSLTKSGRYGESPEPCGDFMTDARRVAFRAAIESTMDSLRLDAMVYPSWNHPAALIDSFQVQYRGDNSQVIAPHTGQPAFTVPMGFTNSGLPAGLQFLGRLNAETTLIRLTGSYETGTQHRKPPLVGDFLTRSPAANPQ